jgi:hypothetical protein
VDRRHDFPFVTERFEVECFEQLTMLRPGPGQSVDRQRFGSSTKAVQVDVCQEFEGGGGAELALQKLFQLAFYQERQHAEGDVGPNLRIRSVPHRPQGENTFDGLKVLFDCILCTVDPDQIGGGPRFLGSGNQDGPVPTFVSPCIM